MYITPQIRARGKQLTPTCLREQCPTSPLAMKIIDAEQTRSCLTFNTVIPALELAFRRNAEVPTRHVHNIECGSDKGTSLIMPAWNSDGYYGVKIINIFSENSKKGIPGLHSTYSLYSAKTGVPLAAVDGDVITAYRTAGAAALGASYLSRKESRVLLILGTGRVASLVASAMKAVRPIDKILVWNYRIESAKPFVESLKVQGFDAQVVPVDDLELAAKQADIISCSTLSTKPLIRRKWLRSGAHLDLIGSFRPDMMEAFPDCFSDTLVYVDTSEAPTKSGDLIEAFKAGSLYKDQIRGTLFDLVNGACEGRADDSQVTVFKAVGTALEDLAMAAMVYEHYEN